MGNDLGKTPQPSSEYTFKSSPGEDRMEALQRDSRLLHALMQHFPDRIYFKDLESRFIYGSRSFAELFGLEDLADIYGKTDHDFFSQEHASAALEDEQEIIRTGEAKLNLEERETWLDGTISWSSTAKAPLRDNEGKIIGTFGISRDITIRKRAQQALVESEARYRQVSEQLASANLQLAEANKSLLTMSLTDPLTGLRNRRFLTTHMPEDIAQVMRAHRNVASNHVDRTKQNVDMLFLMVDLDHFKRVNDLYGHLAGDQVLQQVGEVLCRAARTTDTVARVGGEEFLVVARQTARADSNVIAERIRASVEAHKFRIGRKETIHCTCSVGFSSYPLLPEDVHFFSWEQIVEIADQCLYAAKRNGRNAWVGIIPDQENLRRSGKKLPKHIPDLVRAGLLPTMSSLKFPVVWGEDDGER
jgi:diguanylate cyclase (GGDEF)-like protein/PAS domain S-box-containing protein